MQVDKKPIQIGSVWYYRKINPASREKYISVSDYNKLYEIKVTYNGATKKAIEVYDIKKKLITSYPSITEAAKELKVHHHTIINLLKGHTKSTPKRKVNSRYRFSYKNKVIKPIIWEYSNKQYA